jgi:hypothetical protein
MVKRYQRGVIRSRNSTKDRQHNGQKIPKGLSEAVTQRRTDNTMVKRKKKKRQTKIYKTINRKLKIEHHEPHLKTRVISGSPDE